MSTPQSPASSSLSRQSAATAEPFHCSGWVHVIYWLGGAACAVAVGFYIAAADAAGAVNRDDAAHAQYLSTGTLLILSGVSAIFAAYLLSLLERGVHHLAQIAAQTQPAAASSAVRATDPSQAIYISQAGGESEGPYSAKELRNLIAGGRLHRSTQACRLGETQWATLGSILQLD